MVEQAESVASVEQAGSVALVAQDPEARLVERLERAGHWVARAQLEKARVRGN